MNYLGKGHEGRPFDDEEEQKGDESEERSDIGPPAGVSGAGRFWRHRILVHLGPTIVGAVFYQSPVGTEIGHGPTSILVFVC